MKAIFALLAFVSVLVGAATAYAQEVPTTTEPPSTTVPVPTTVPPTTEVLPTTVPPTTTEAPVPPPPSAPVTPESQPLASVRDVGSILLPAEYRSTHSFSITAGNLNGDSRPDLVFGLHSRIRAYLNLPGGLELVLEHNGADSHGCDIGDVNGDSRGDIYCVLGGGHGSRSDKATPILSRGQMVNLLIRVLLWERMIHMDVDVTRASPT